MYLGRDGFRQTVDYNMMMEHGLGALIAAAKRRLRLAWAARTVSDVGPYLLLALGIVGSISWLVGRVLAWWVYPIVFVAALCSLIAAARLLRIADVDAARAVEHGVGHDGVLISALEFDDADDDWHRAVHQRAAVVVEDPAAYRAVPIRFDLRRVAVSTVAVAMIATAGVLAPIGGPGIAAADQDRLDLEAEALEEVAELLEDAADDADDPLEAESLDEAADEVRRLVEEIRSAESPIDAAERLEREAETLRSEAGDDRLTDKAAVQGLEQQLSASPLSQGGDAASQLDSLAGELEGLTDAERDELADRLDALASSQTNGNQDVADALESSAAALRASDLSSASSALETAAAAQRTAVGDVARRDASAAAANAASGAAGRLRDGDGDGRGDGDGNGDGDGDGNGNGDGDGNGNGSGDSEGNGNGNGTGDGSGESSGSGQGRGQGGGSPSGEVGGASPSAGQSQGQGGQGTPGAGDITPGENGVEQAAEVFDPVNGGPSVDVDVDIDGGTGEGQVTGRSDSATSEGDSFVPYQDVLPSYLETAATALDELDLPPDLRTTVRDYFDQIAER